MEKEKPTSGIECCSDGEENEESSYYSIFDEHDGVDDDWGTHHGVGQVGDNFKRAVSSFLDNQGVSELPNFLILDFLGQVFFLLNLVDFDVDMCRVGLYHSVKEINKIQQLIN